MYKNDIAVVASLTQNKSPTPILLVKCKLVVGDNFPECLDNPPESFSSNRNFLVLNQGLQQVDKVHSFGCLSFQQQLMISQGDLLLFEI